MTKAKITPLQRFHLAWVALSSVHQKYTSNRTRKPVVADGKVLRSMRALAALKLVILTPHMRGSDDFWTVIPTEAGYDEVKNYKPDTPERQVQMWGVKAPQLRTLCRFINEHVEGFAACLRDWSFTPSHKIKGTRLSSFGRRRKGKRLEVCPTKDRLGRPLLTVDGPDPDDHNEKAVNWIAEKMGVELRL